MAGGERTVVGLRPFAAMLQVLQRSERQCGVVDESDADDMEPPLSLELVDPDDIAPEDMELEDIAS